MFLTSGEIASDAAEYFRSFHSPEASGNLLLNFGHANIPLALIISEGHVFSRHEAQRLGFEITQSLQKISGLRLFLPALFWLGLLWRAWTFFISFVEQGPVANQEFFRLFFRKASASCVDTFSYFDEEQFHGFCPLLSVLFPRPFELAKMMGVTEGVKTFEAEVGFPMVVTQGALEVL